MCAYIHSFIILQQMQDMIGHASAFTKPTNTMSTMPNRHPALLPVPVCTSEQCLQFLCLTNHATEGCSKKEGPLYLGVCGSRAQLWQGLSVGLGRLGYCYRRWQTRHACT